MKKYVIIIPVRDEEDNIEKTILCFLNQTLLPHRLIIVDDGSKDTTAEKIRKLVTRFSSIIFIQREDRGYRRLGQGVVEAFNVGYEWLKQSGLDYDFIGKFDADIDFSNDYFEKLIEEFTNDDLLGLAAGRWMIRTNGKLKPKIAPADYVPGMSKFYRKTCFEEIGGFAPMRLFDMIDGIQLEMKGYKVKIFDNLHCIQTRKMDEKEKWKLAAKFEKGIAYHFIGYDPLFMIIKCIKQSLTESPFIILGGSVWLGYVYAAFFKRKTFSEDLKRFLRKKQKTLIYFNYFVAYFKRTFHKN